MAFKKIGDLLSESSRKRLREERLAVDNLYSLSDAALCGSLLTLARQARYYTHFGPNDPVYDSQFFWHGVPELARRLGFKALIDQESDPEWAALTDAQLRVRLGNCIFNTSREPTKTPSPGAPKNPMGWALLTREPCNGNPVAFALDRLCPPDLSDRDDKLVRHMLEIGAHRGQTGACWTPAWNEERPADYSLSLESSDLAPVEPTEDSKPRDVAAP